MKELLNLIENYGYKCKLVGYCDGLDEDDPIMISARNEREKSFEAIKNDLDKK